jgi:hypothetical protein
MPIKKTIKTKTVSRKSTKIATQKSASRPSATATATAPLTVQAELNGQPVNIKNEGQKVIYLIRKAYLEGALAVSTNPTSEVQFILNKPVEIKPEDYRPEPRDKVFLQEIINKVEGGNIKLFTPSTLLNMPVYDQLPSDKKAKADYDILILLHKIRQVKKLWDEGARDSYQIMNLVHSLRLAKERLETQQGDVFVI